MDSLLSACSADVTSYSVNYTKHKLTKKDYQPVPHRWYFVLSLHLAGSSVKEIKEETGYSIPFIYRILSMPAIITARQQLLDSTQQEFEALFQKIVDNVRLQLNSNDPQVQLAAQQQWFKANGRFSNVKIDKSVHITAEQVVAKILNGEVQKEVVD